MQLATWHNIPEHRVGSILTFIGHFEAQRTTGVICFEIEPHLVTGANHEVRSGCTREATRGDKLKSFLNQNAFKKKKKKAWIHCRFVLHIVWLQGMSSSCITCFSYYKPCFHFLHWVWCQWNNQRPCFFCIIKIKTNKKKNKTWMQTERQHPKLHIQLSDFSHQRKSL